MTDIAPFPARARAAGAQGRPCFVWAHGFEPSAADPRPVAVAWPEGGEVA